MRQQILTMLELQDAMNSRVHSDWRERRFEWYRAIWIECAELLDHYGWKWWKKQTPDIDQVKLELVDIWHFGLSILLLEGDDREQTAIAVEGALGGAPAPGDFRADLESFALQSLSTRHFDVPGFKRLMLGAGLDFEELYTRYVGKNVLNFFRQDNGYQEGTYIKQWQGREDNEHLVDIIGELDAASPSFKDDLYSSLQYRYAQLVE